MSGQTIHAIAGSLCHEFTVARYHQLIDSGILTEDDRVELIEGVIVAVSPRSPDHAFPIVALTRLLSRALGDEWSVRIQLPLTLARSEPEPDVAIVARALEAAAPQHPSSALLIVEVARASLALDRAMAAIYAAANVPEYWIVDVEARQVEVHRDPAGDAYRSHHLAVVGTSISPVALPGTSVAVAGLFRPAVH